MQAADPRGIRRRARRLHELDAMGTHAFEPHRGEIKVRLDAATTRELFVEAAHALADLLGTPTDVAAGPWLAVTATARDIDALLVAWLNELFAQTAIHRLLFVDVAVLVLSARRIDACIRGVRFRETPTAVKTATMHDVRIGSSPEGTCATVVLAR
jgi:SHS2 domain-containing protein